MVEKEEEVKKLTPAEIVAEQRKNIKVTVAEKEVEEKEETETDADTETEKEVEETVEEEVETAEKEVEEAEKTEEELKAEKAAATTQAQKDRVQRKIDKEVGKRKAAEDRVKELEAKLAEKPDADKALTEADVERRAQEKVLSLQFVKDCNVLAEAATKIDKDFVKKMNEVGEEVGPIPGQMIGILTDLDNGGDILAHYVKDENIDDYEKIIAMSPAKMAVELAKLSTKLTEAKKKIKPISKAPDPAEPVGGNSRTTNLEAARQQAAKKGDMKEFARIRALEQEERRKQKMRAS